MPRRKKQKQEGLTETQKLAAITWAAEKAGESYGRFAIHLQPQDRETIFSLYQQLLEERDHIARKRLELYRQKNRRSRPRSSAGGNKILTTE